MATSVSQLLVKLIDGVSAPARKAAGALRGIGQAAQAIHGAQVNLRSAIERNSAAMDAARGRMIDAVAAAYALKEALSAPLQVAIDFQTQLENIGQKAGIPQERLAALAVQIRAVARDVNQAGSVIAAGMDTLVGLGMSDKDALAILGPLGKAASAYQAQIEELAAAGYAALFNLKVPADQFVRALDAMAAAGKAGAFELKDMAQYFPALGAAYQGLGQTGVGAVADLAAALQVARMGAGDSAEAATNLGNVLQKINAPATRKAFKKMGVNLEKEMQKAAERGLTPIEAIAEITNRTLGGDLSKLGDLFEDAQVQKGLRAIIQNIEEYRRIRREAMAAQGIVEEDYQRRLRTTLGFLNRFRATWENMQAAIGAALLPGLNDLLDTLSSIANSVAAFAEANPELVRSIVSVASSVIALNIALIGARYALLFMKGGLLQIALGAVMAGQAVGRAALAAGLVRLAGIAQIAGLRFRLMGRDFRAGLIGIGGLAQGTFATLTRALLGLLNPIGLVRAAIVGLKMALISTGIGAILIGIAMAGTWIYNNWSGIKEMFAGIADGIKSTFPGASAAIDAMASVVKTLFGFFTDLTGTINATEAEWRAFGQAIGAAIGGFLADMIALPGKIKDAFVGAASALYDAGMQMIQSLWDGMIAKFNELLAWAAGLGARIAKAIGIIDLSNLIRRTTGFTPGPAADTPMPTTDPLGNPIPARASGGPILAGRPTLVGELGPEIITAGSSGYVHPNSKIGGMGGLTVNQTISASFNGASQSEISAFARMLADELEFALRGVQADYGFGFSD